MQKNTFLRIFLLTAGLIALIAIGQAQASSSGQGGSGGGGSSGGIIQQIFFTPLMQFHVQNETFFTKIYRGSINIASYPLIIVWNTGYRIFRGPVPDHWLE